jgi:hypothetical protein
VVAAEFDRRIAHRDADTLRLSAAQPPELGRGERGGRDARSRGGADRERGGQRRLGAGEFELLEGGFGLRREAPEARERVFRFLRSAHDAPTLSARRGRD